MRLIYAIYDIYWRRPTEPSKGQILEDIFTCWCQAGNLTSLTRIASVNISLIRIQINQVVQYNLTMMQSESSSECEEPDLQNERYDSFVNICCNHINWLKLFRKFQKRYCQILVRLN